MKLTQANKNAPFQPMARHDVAGPMRVANVRAQAAKAWGNVAEQAGNMMSDVLMRHVNFEESKELVVADTAYNKIMGEVNSLENAVYSNPNFRADDPYMEGITTEGGAEFVPTKDIGGVVWNSNVQKIMSGGLEGMAEGKAKRQLIKRLENQMLSKNQQVERHIMGMNIRDTKSDVVNSIGVSTVTGDFAGAMDSIEKHLEYGTLTANDAAVLTENTKKAWSMSTYNEAISQSNDAGQLSDIAISVLDDSNQYNFLTEPQRMAMSQKALAKIGRIAAEQRVEITAFQDGAEVDAIMGIDEGTFTKSHLKENKSSYSRAGFTRLMARLDASATGDTVGSETADLYGREIANVDFESNESIPSDQLRGDIKLRMMKSVQMGTLTPKAYNDNMAQMTKDEKRTFNSVAYRETKTTIQSDILHTAGVDISAMTVMEGATGLNLTEIMAAEFKTKPWLLNINTRAVAAMNEELRKNPNSSPIEWWKDNKDSYFGAIDKAETESKEGKAAAAQMSSVPTPIEQVRKSTRETLREGGISTEEMVEIDRAAAAANAVDPIQGNVDTPISPFMHNEDVAIMRTLRKQYRKHINYGANPPSVKENTNE